MNGLKAIAEGLEQEARRMKYRLMRRYAGRITAAKPDAGFCGYTSGVKTEMFGERMDF